MAITIKFPAKPKALRFSELEAGDAFQFVNHSTVMLKADGHTLYMNIETGRVVTIGDQHTQVIKLKATLVVED